MASWTRLCVGGPLDGNFVMAFSSEGFIATNRAEGKAWIYKADGDRWKLCTDHDNSLSYPAGRQTGERRIDWDRLPLSSDALTEVKLGDTDEAQSGDPVDDGW
jgi:hypothetical protein